VPEQVAAEVARLVSLTAGHATEDDDPDGELLCDADLAILASDPQRYADYTAAIRREYAHVPEHDFRAGRATVLRELLKLPTLYRLAPLRDAWETRARANIATELAALG
jgi:predicted metal-dependent HD superfamily phosphohydrolase